MALALPPSDDWLLCFMYEPPRTPGASIRTAWTNGMSAGLPPETKDPNEFRNPRRRPHPDPSQGIERNATLLMVLSLVVVAIGGIVEIAPLFYLQNTIEKVTGMRPYSPLELLGRQIYIREGCYTCHSQMIRPMRDEVERYGHYSLAAESMYDHPFQWGSKRTGPDLAQGRRTLFRRMACGPHGIDPQRAGAGIGHARLSLAGAKPDRSGQSRCDILRANSRNWRARTRPK